ncbi:MAG TPA: hypothetical protein VF748_00465 [Candidatus Acidoferrum sp.]
MVARGYERKTDLTPLEQVKVTYFHLCRGVDQHILADVFDVNIGRVNEAIMAVKKAAGFPPNPR